jgi:hypothetical protein
MADIKSELEHNTRAELMELRERILLMERREKELISFLATFDAIKNKQTKEEPPGHELEAEENGEK